LSNNNSNAPKDLSSWEPGLHQAAIEYSVLSHRT
jgi:hypothetical protein